MTNPADVAALIKKVMDEYKKIDILCNVAGGIASRVPYDQAKPEDWDKDIRLNLYSIMLTCQAVLPYMREKKSGVIVNIGSGSTRMYSHGTGNTYAISKAGVDTFTKQLAFNEAKNGIRCNCVAPGPAPTNFIPGPDKQGDDKYAGKDDSHGQRRHPDRYRQCHHLLRIGSLQLYHRRDTACFRRVGIWTKHNYFYFILKRR